MYRIPNLGKILIRCFKYYFFTLKKYEMRWCVVFLLAAVVAAILGFGEFANGFSGIAKISFLVFISCFFISFFNGKTSEHYSKIRLPEKH